MKKASNQPTLNIDYRKLGGRIKPKGEKGYTPMSDEANHMCRVRAPRPWSPQTLDRTVKSHLIIIRCKD